MRRRTLLNAVSLVLLLTCAGCIGGTGVEDAMSGDVPGAGGLQTIDLSEVDTLAIVEGLEITLEAALWRDFVPGPDPRDTSLKATLRLVTPGAALPQGIVGDSAAVVCGSERWVTQLGSPDATGFADTLSYHLSGGPAWPTGATADVVIQFYSAAQRLVRLRVSDRMIQRIE